MEGANSGKMQGQLSIEYLLLFLTALFIFGISLGAMVHLQDLSKAYSEKVSFSKNAKRLLYRIEEVCILGNGNSREVLLTMPLSVEGSMRGGQVKVYAGDSSISKRVGCRVRDASNLHGLVVVKNDENYVVFEPT